MATNKPVGDNARKRAVKRSSRRRAAPEVGMSKLGMKCCVTGLQKDALVTLIDTNQYLRKKAVSLMLEIAILRDR